MTLVATVRLDAPTIEATLERTPQMTLAVEGRTRTRSGRLRLTTRVAGAEPSTVEAALDADATVRRWVSLGRGDERGLYRVELTEEAASSADYERWTDGRAIITAERWDGDAWTVEGRFRDRSVLRRFATRCEANGVRFSLRRVSESQGLSDGRQFGLTDLQARSLRFVLDEGLYDVPRRTTLEELAATLDVSHQALSERLRRGIGTLLEQTLADGAPEGDHATGRRSVEGATRESVAADQSLVADL